MPVGQQPYLDFESGLFKILKENDLKKTLLVVPFPRSQLFPIRVHDWSFSRCKRST